MNQKTIIYLIAILIIILLAFAAGIHTGSRRARQACIDTVAENCDYICGVGKDFTFPDQQYSDPDPDQYEHENALAYKLN